MFIHCSIFLLFNVLYHRVWHLWQQKIKTPCRGMFWGSFCRLLDDEKYSLTISPVAIFLSFSLDSPICRFSLFFHFPSPNSQLPTLFPLLSSFFSNFFTLFSYIFFGFCRNAIIISLMEQTIVVHNWDSVCFFLSVVSFCNLLISSCISGFCIFPSSFLDWSPLFHRFSKYKDN